MAPTAVFFTAAVAAFASASSAFAVLRITNTVGAEVTAISSIAAPASSTTTITATASTTVALNTTVPTLTPDSAPYLNTTSPSHDDRKAEVRLLTLFGASGMQELAVPSGFKLGDGETIFVAVPAGVTVEVVTGTSAGTTCLTSAGSEGTEVLLNYSSSSSSSSTSKKVGGHTTTSATPTSTEAAVEDATPSSSSSSSSNTSVTDTEPTFTTVEVDAIGTPLSLS